MRHISTQAHTQSITIDAACVSRFRVARAACRQRRRGPYVLGPSRGQRRPTRVSRARRVPLRGSLDAASVEAESVEVRDGDFLVLGSHSTWAHLAGDEAVQAVNGWMREQGPERLSRDGRGAGPFP